MDAKTPDHAAVPDWGAIRLSFEEEGSQSVRAIGRAHGVSHAAIRKRAAKEGWRRAEKEDATVSDTVSSTHAETDTLDTGVTYSNDSGKPEASPSVDKLLERNYLVTLRDVRLAISKIIRGEAAGNVEHHRARGLVWMLRQLCDVILDADLEKRLSEIEARQLAGSFGEGSALPAILKSIPATKPH